jgi:hypothetical protein
LIGGGYTHIIVWNSIIITEVIAIFIKAGIIIPILQPSFGLNPQSLWI